MIPPPTLPTIAPVLIPPLASGSTEGEALGPTRLFVGEDNEKVFDMAGLAGLRVGVEAGVVGGGASVLLLLVVGTLLLLLLVVSSDVVSSVVDSSSCSVDGDGVTSAGGSEDELGGGGGGSVLEGGGGGGGEVEEGGGGGGEGSETGSLVLLVGTSSSSVIDGGSGLGTYPVCLLALLCLPKTLGVPACMDISSDLQLKGEREFAWKECRWRKECGVFACDLAFVDS